MRLANQQLVSTKCKTPKEVVSWMGAVQAQDYNMAKWAVGTRLLACTDKQVEEALNRSDILRTHILRPTWHLVANEDIRWMLQLTAPRNKMALATYTKAIGIDSTTIVKTLPKVLKMLEGGNHLTRQEMGEALDSAGVKFTHDHALNQILFHAEIDGLVCSGAVKGKKQTYALLDEITPALKNFSKEESLAKLAGRFFTSHAPATLQDFTWWSGLTKTDARKALEMVKAGFISEEVDGQTYWFTKEGKDLSVAKNIVHLLPAFDEYVVSYKDRKDIFEHGSYSKVISTNGIFKPTVMVNGQVAGMWKRVVKGKKVTAETELFIKLDSKVKKAVDQEVERFTKYNDSL